MNYKFLIYPIALIILSFSVLGLFSDFGNYNLDRDDYLEVDTGNFGLNNVSVSDTNSVTTGGWSIESGDGQYSNVKAFNTTQSFTSDGAGDDYYKTLTINSTNITCSIYSAWDSIGCHVTALNGGIRVASVGVTQNGGINPNYFIVTQHNAWQTDTGVSYNNGTNAWNEYTIQLLQNNVSIWANGVLLIYDNADTSYTIDGFRVWNSYNANKCYFDQLYCWSGRPNDRPKNPPASAVSSVTVLLESLNGSFLNDNDIKEDTTFFTLANYTIDGIVESSGVCSVSMNNVSSHFSVLSDSNFTLSSSENLLSLITNDDFNNLRNDFISFRVCRENIKTDLQIYVNGSVHKTLDQNIIPLCSVGFHEENNITELYNSNRSLNISLKCNDCNGGTRQLTILSHDGDTLHYERDFISHTETLSFNVSTNLYDYHDHLYHSKKSGLFNVSVNCNDTVTDRIFSVGDVLPTITVLSINNIPFIEGFLVESSLNYSLLIDVFGDVVNQLSFNLSFANGTLINSSGSENLIVSSSLISQGGIFNISVFVIDDDGNSTDLDTYFTINDTTIPSVVWSNPNNNNNTLVTRLQNMNILLQLSDTNLFGYQLAIFDNSSNLIKNFTLLNINTTIHSISENFIPNTTGIFKGVIDVWDSHTDRIIREIPNIVDQKDIIFSNNGKDLTITYTGIHTFRKQPIVKKEDDRYTIEYNFDLVDYRFQESVTHKWRVLCAKSYYIPTSKYIGHLVCFDSRMWYDAQDDGVLNDVIVSACGDGCFNIIASARVEEIIKTRSVGVLNTFHEVVQFEVINSSVAKTYDKNLISFNDWFNYDDINTNTTQGVLLFMFLLIIVIALIVFSEYSQIPALMILTGLVVFFFSILLFTTVSVVFGIVGIVLFLFYSIRGVLLLL